MKTDFFEKIYNHPNIQKEDYTNIIDAHTKVEFLKNDTILSEGKISNEYYLIKKGLFRSYVIDYKGNEITTDFFSPNDILIEVASLFLRIPSKETIQNKLTSISEEEKEKMIHTIKKITSSISILIDKKLELFSSKVNQT